MQEQTSQPFIVPADIMSPDLAASKLAWEQHLERCAHTGASPFGMNRRARRTLDAQRARLAKKPRRAP